MVGLGETYAEILGLMQDLRRTGCDLLTIGQYLRPTQLNRHLPVKRFVSLEEFAEYQRAGESLGFRHVMSGPLVRSSFIAEEGYQACLKPQVP